MSYIEVAIKIPKEMYKWIYDVNKSDNDYETSDFIDLIKNGTRLPKGHDRLIYAKDVGVYLTLADVPTVIEADIIEADETKNEG